MRPPLLASILLFAITGCGTSAPSPAQTMHDAHANDAPTPTAAVAGIDTLRTEAREVTYATVGGRPVRGYLARPVDPPNRLGRAGQAAGPAGALPGIILIHEWWGLNDNIRAMARRLASEGYVTLAVDLYGGRTAGTPDEARALMQETLTQGEVLMSSIDQALTHLRVVQGAPRVGVIGWCFGGGWSLETALAHPNAVDAAVMYYGRVVTDEGRLATLEAPLLGHFGATDSGIPVADVQAMASTLEGLGKDVDVHIYEGAGHAFANASGQAYVAEAAETAWGRTLAFFERHLRG